jgi:DNA-binding transcriptional MocR family regulator
VLRSSSFSKIVAPGIRVGYFVLPPELAAELEAVAVNTWLAPSYLSQATLYEFLRRGNLGPNVERVAARLRERRDAMLEALGERLEGTRWSRPEGGYFLWLELREGVDAGGLLDRAEAAGVTFVKGSDFYPGGVGGQNAIRLAYSFVSRKEIRDGIGRLGSLLAPVAA